MVSGKKIAVLSGILVALVILALWAIVKTRPNMTPLTFENAEPSSFQKIEIKKLSETIVLERKPNGWFLTEPIKDHADQGSVNDFLTTLAQFSPGPVVSENPNRFAQFQIDEASSTHLKIYQKDPAKPALDLYLGKEGTSYGTSYIKLINEKVVRLGSGLFPWMLSKTALDYRLKNLIPAKKENVQQFEITGTTFSISVARSSDTWTLKGSTSSLVGEWAPLLLDHVLNLRSYEFGTGQEKPEDLGWEKPYATISVMTSSGPIKAEVGSFEIKDKKKDKTRRYAKMEGRDTTLLLNSPAVDEIVNSASKTPK